LVRRRRFDRPLGGYSGYRVAHELLWKTINGVKGREFTARDLARMTGVDEKTVRKHLWDFVEEGQIEAVGQVDRFVSFRQTTH
jgi:Fic family protein